MLSIGACFAGLYAVYYLFYVVKKPKIACGGSKLKNLIFRHCPIASERYWPTWWCIEARFQTVLRALIQSSPIVKYSSEFLEAPDGGEIRLDWEENESGSQYPEKARPTVLLIPGLTGSSDGNYILHLVHEATDLGYRCVVFNNRGTGGTILKTSRTYCAANTEDLEFVINHVKNKYPDSPLVATGVSLGGMILFNYLARTGEAARVDGAMCISVVWDALAGTASLTETLNYYLFNKPLAKSLIDLVEKNVDLFKHLDTEHIKRSESIKDFDERFTCKVFGYESVEDYYQDGSLHYPSKLKEISRPVLCLNAADDPFSPEKYIPFSVAEQKENVAIVVTSHGGHIGFLEGSLPGHKNYMYRWFRQYVKAMFDHGVTTE